MSSSTRAIFAQQLGVATVAAGEGEGGEQARDTMIEDGEVLSASLVARGAGEPAFADAARPGDDADYDRARIHSQAASLRNRARSRPRAAR